MHRSEGRGVALALLALTLAVAGFVRLAWLGRDGLWLDEASVAKASSSASLPRLVAEARLDNQPPGFHLAVAAVTRALGGGEWQMRLVSALAGLATVALVFEVGASAFSPAAGLSAALLLALNPLAVHYSREARPYALLALCGLLAFRAALALERRPTAPRAALVAASLVAVLYVHAIAAFVVATLAVTFLVRALGAGAKRRWLLRAWSAILAAAALAYLPWLAALRQQTAEIGGSYAWALERWQNWFPWQLPASAGALGPGSLPPFYNNLTSITATGWIGGALLLLLAAAALARRHAFAWPAAPGVCAILAVVPLVLLFSVSLVAQPVYTVGRVEMLVQPFAMLLAGAGLAGLPAPLRPLIPVLVVGLAWPALDLEIQSGYRSTERDLVAAVARDSEPGDAVVVTGPLRHVFEYYLGRWGSGLAIESWPARRAAHPHWIDWSREDPAALTAEARALTARLGHDAPAVPVPGPGHAWLVLMEEGGNGIVAAEMERAFPRDLRVEQPGWHLELRRYRLAPVR